MSLKHKRIKPVYIDTLKLGAVCVSFKKDKVVIDFLTPDKLHITKLIDVEMYVASCKEQVRKFGVSSVQAVRKFISSYTPVLEEYCVRK